MPTATETSMDATIARVLFHAPSKFDPSGLPFTILKLSDGTVAKGQMRRPIVGAEYRFFGGMAPQKNGYADAFEFHSFEPLVSQGTSGVADYLARHVEGIGPVRAKAIVEHFGEECLTVLRTDADRVTEVEGITEAIVATIKAHFADSRKYDPVAYAKLIDMFKDYRISKRVVESLLKSFGSDAPEMVTANPYLLLNYPRVGWKTADAFALGKAGYDPGGAERHEAAVLESLEQIAGEGHTAATEAELLGTAGKLMGDAVNEGTIKTLIAKGEVIEGDDGAGTIYQIAKLAEAEKVIAERLAIIAANGRPLPGIVTDEWAAAAGLGTDQFEAAKIIEDHAACIITGAPGVGKTYVISRIIRAMQAAGMTSIRCVAPTGKASKRLAELLADAGVSGVPSTTIHKALEPVPSVAAEGVPTDDARFGRGREPFAFGRNEQEPLTERIIIVDETSMVDVKLMASLLRAVKPGTRVIFVGDHNQLPSVGPGSVLRDMIAAGVPTAELTEIRRSDGGGTIVKACHAIKDGIAPQAARRIDLPTENWVHIEASDPAEIAGKIVEFHARAKNFDPLWGMQVVSPQKGKLPIGCENLNRMLSRQLNPSAHRMEHGRPGEEEGGDREPQFKAGDKVVRTKNAVVDELIAWEDRESCGRIEVATKSRPDMEWRGLKYVAVETPVVNGDMGMVEDIIEGDKPSVIVRFRDPERLVRLPHGEAHIIMAYAMTVHKCQGSGFPCVIMPLHNSFYYDQKSGGGLWVKELVYTGISRAEKMLVTVGQWSALVAAIGRKTVHRRKTMLARRIGEIPS